MSSFQNWENNELCKSKNSIFLNVSFFTECLLATQHKDNDNIKQSIEWESNMICKYWGQQSDIDGQQ